VDSILVRQPAKRISSFHNETSIKNYAQIV